MCADRLQASNGKGFSSTGRFRKGALHTSMRADKENRLAAAPVTTTHLHLVGCQVALASV